MSTWPPLFASLPPFQCCFIADIEDLQQDMENINLPDTRDSEKIEMGLFEGGRHLIAHQISSFERFLGEDVQKLVEEEFKEVEVLPSYGAAPGTPHKKSTATSREPAKPPGWRRAKLSFQQVQVFKPEWASQEGHVKPLFPHEARIRKLTYSAEVKADVHVKVYKPRELGQIHKGKGKQSTPLNVGKGKQSMPMDIGIGEENLKQEDIDQDELVKSVSIGRIPVMVQSSYCQLHGLSKQTSLQRGHCHFDVGGYFIIKGSEKVLITQEEQVRSPRCIRLRDEKGFQSRFLLASKGLSSRTSNVMVNLKYHTVEEKRSSYEQKTPYLTVQLPFIKMEINVVVMLRALGITTDKQLIDIIGLDLEDTQMFDMVRPTLEAAESDMLPWLWDAFKEQLSQSSEVIKTAALKLLEGKLRSKTEETPSQILQRCLFPDIMQDDRTKAMHLGYMVAQVLACSLGRRREDDIHCLSKKRLDLAGDLLLMELKSKLFKFRRELQRGLQKALVKEGNIDLQKHAVPFSLENAFLTGNWAQAPGTLTPRQGGLVVPLDRENPLATISHLRQTELSANPKARLRDARYPNLSYIGRFCLVQSPDGEKCGLVKSLAFSSRVSSGSPEKDVFEVLKQLSAVCLEDASLDNLRNMSKVLLNGRWVAVHENARGLARSMRLMRRTMNLHHQVEIAEDASQKEVRICCDSGRILRPLLILAEKSPPQFRLELKRKLGSSVNWNAEKLLEAGIIEYVGPEEEAGCMVAVDLEDVKNNGSLKNFTHCEIHPALMFGVSASLIPFANHNHTLRVLHQAQKHCRQAIGFYSTCLQARVDTSGQNLLYPQKPLVGTRFSRLLERSELANGQNAIVAVCPYMGFNQEDSLVMNQSSIDRGIFNSMHYRCFSTLYKQNEEVMTKPAESDARRSNRPYAAYSKLDSDGLPQVGTNCFPRDVVFGKVSALQTNGLYEDRSIDLKACEKGRVDRVIVASDDADNTVARVFLREKRAPVVGDKFSSMHGQKGVVGLIVRDYDLPFTRQGITPDLIINPHAFPSRQTIGQLLESHFGKVSGIKGRFFDGTAYTHMPMENITHELHRLGFNQWGYEAMVNGQTGEMMDARIFIGPAFYQRLTKMAEDQLKYRRQGPTHPLTRQPVDDRKRHGGIRIGEMERDCLLGHGVASNIQERLFLLSDPYQVYVCQGCNRMATKDGNKHVRICRFCKTSKHIVCLDVPYACKLLYQELLSMGICMRLKTELD
ncbi:hypothetical protein GOP47_0014799 [Adiantum capillus-veneris]|uniref:DNA-directed RNA polymerase subunit beta n=1 Tax=Adiantum capillus-veneris TaxID=13818 RepID=A0A9D4UMY5_ADICA|nr:hypothetical protein GOP47_0014799 [Adiantum capillus-veneris]